jgi:hypothetical protein
VVICRGREGDHTFHFKANLIIFPSCISALSIEGFAKVDDGENIRRAGAKTHCFIFHSLLASALETLVSMLHARDRLGC